jgi:ATP-binding cassette subfamily F protein uup
VPPVSTSYISAELRRLVVARAESLCEYCLIHEDDTFFGCEVDHIITRAFVRARHAAGDGAVSHIGGVAAYPQNRWWHTTTTVDQKANLTTNRREYFAGYAQWESNRPHPAAPTRDARPTARPRAKRLSYKEQREWDTMEATVHAAEDRLTLATAAAHDPSIAADATLLQQRFAALTAAQAEVDRLYARWAELEGKLAG